MNVIVSQHNIIVCAMYVNAAIMLMLIVGPPGAYGHPACVPVYGGGVKCSYLPAPPGHTPSCAKPGLTYCEKIPHYPMQRIVKLINNWGYDHSTLLNSEAQVEFNANRQDDYSPKYPVHHNYPEPIFVPKPSPIYHSDNYNTGYQYGPQKNPFLHHKNTYLPPNKFNGFVSNGSYSYDRPNNGYNNNYNPEFAHQNSNYNQNFNSHQHQPQFQPSFNNHNQFAYSPAASHSDVTSYSPAEWLTRYYRDSTGSEPYVQYSNKRRIIRSAATSTVSSDANQFRQLTNTTAPFSRPKRQSGGNMQQLCPTRSQYVMPKAAQNTAGNWMYVVNVGETDNRYTQLVKSETCIGQVCSGLCTLPAGYTARCEQKYVQKRLVALEEGGQRLYTDTFWFPSCCLCTITN